MKPTTENSSAIVQLHEDVSVYFKTEVPNAPPVLFGRRERTKQINDGSKGANRIVFVPGKLDGGDGPIMGASGPGEVIFTNEDGTINHVKPRILFTQPKILTISLWASNNENPEVISDERAQHEALEQMEEWLFRAVQNSSLVGVANAQWTSTKYNANPVELRYGLEYLFEVTIETNFYDVVPNVVIPSAAVSRSDS